MDVPVQKPATELKENHRRSISISLQLLDKQLCQWEEWLEGHVAPGVMYQQQNALSVRQKSQLRDRIADLRRRMIRLRDDFQLAPVKPRTTQLIVGQATVLWEMLAELNSRSLQGYGAVPDELARYLDPIGEKLAAAMHEISLMFSGATTATNKGDY
jgi:hypothetical protein